MKKYIEKGLFNRVICYSKFYLSDRSKYDEIINGFKSVGYKYINKTEFEHPEFYIIEPGEVFGVYYADYCKCFDSQLSIDELIDMKIIDFKPNQWIMNGMWVMQYYGCSQDGGIIGKNAFEFITKFEHDNITISYTTPELSNWQAITEEEAKQTKDNMVNCAGACCDSISTDDNNKDEKVFAIA